MGLHRAWPDLQSLIPEALFNRLQTAQVDPSMPVKAIEHLPFVNRATGELLNSIPVDRFYRFHRSKICAMLAEGLNIKRGKRITDLKYSGDRSTITAHFHDGTSDTGCLLIGSDGPHSKVRKLLLGAEQAKVVPIGLRRHHML